jgi:hypothetical protein
MRRPLTELLPVGPGRPVERLHYSEAAGCVVVTIVGDHGRRVFMRRIGAPDYKEVRSPSPTQQFVRVVLAAAPYAFLLARDDATKIHFLYQLLLANRELIASPPLVSPSAGRTWISDLVGCSPDATYAFVIVGSHPPPDPLTGYTVTYTLSRLAVATGELTAIEDLQSPFA